MRVRIAHSEREFSCDAGEVLLDAALAAGLNLPHSCRGGNCGACRALMLQGRVSYPGGPPLGLVAAEVAQGHVLLCQAHALSDLTLELTEIKPAADEQVKRLPCRIERTEPLAHDVMGVHLKLPAAEPFAFKPGQYLDFLLPGSRRRSFSIASPPHDARLVELHVRAVPGGVFSERLFRDGMQGTLLEIEGPLGNFYYRDDDPRRAMILVGGGTGIAPLLSILRHVIENGLGRDICCYWGVRAERDLYALGTLERLSALTPRFSFCTVLSEPGSDWTGRTGWVHSAALDDLGADLSGDRHDVYAAGPPAMITALRSEALARGLPPGRVYFDSFDYAPDAALRQDKSADTRS